MSEYVYNNKILFVDDEENILKSLSRLMHRIGFEAVTTTSTKEALEFVKTNEFSVIVSDFRMPEMTGTEFLAATKAISPLSFRILLTGYADISAAIMAVNESQIFKYLTKPWDDVQIQSVLDDACNGYNLIAENKFLQKKLQETNKNLEALVDKRTEEIQQLNKKLESGFLGSIKVMGAVAHRRNIQSAHHSRNVASLCLELGRALGWKSRELLELQIAGYLHNIADTPEESYKLMLLVPNLGSSYEYVRLFREPALKKGQTSSHIPLGARILGVAEAYNNLLHLKGTQVGATPDKVLLDLKLLTPEKYDAQVVDILVAVLSSDNRMNRENYETTVGIFALTTGVVLSRDLFTKSGSIVAGKDIPLTKEYVSKILKRHIEDPIVDEIHVYKSTLNQTGTRR